jgi:hypothetical protein
MLAHAGAVIACTRTVESARTEAEAVTAYRDCLDELAGVEGVAGEPSTLAWRRRPREVSQPAAPALAHHRPDVRARVTDASLRQLAEGRLSERLNRSSRRQQVSG